MSCGEPVPSIFTAKPDSMGQMSVFRRECALPMVSAEKLATEFDAIASDNKDWFRYDAAELAKELRAAIEEVREHEGL